MSPDWNELATAIQAEYEGNRQEYLRAHWISKTMHPDMRPLASKYWKELAQDFNFATVVLPAAIDSPAGKPYPFEHFPLISPQSIQHAFYIRLMAKHGIVLHGQGSICEVGGGYGNFARIVRSLGYTGSYQIIDLPQIHGLQQKFLAEAYPDHGIKFSSIQDMEPADSRDSRTCGPPCS